jgi:phosphotransferase system IIB component
MESYQKFLNKQQTALRQVMMGFDQHEEAIDLFMRQHAMLHSAKVSGAGLWSFEDSILDDISEEEIRRIPQGEEHSVAWCVWHIARIEDVAMNLLVAGKPQVQNQDNWLTHMRIDVQDTGNGMDQDRIANLSALIDIEALRAYRVVVGRGTREIVEQLEPEELKQKVDPARLARVMEEGALIEAAKGIRDYWSKRNIAGLLLMPATRHNLVHLNEALRLQRRRR